MVTLVTGANRGIGLEISRQLAKNGETVILAGRQRQAINDVIRKLEIETGNHNLHGLTLDVSDVQSIRAAAQEVAKEYPNQIDLLINNAGVLIPKWDAKTFDDTIAINYTGVLELTDHLLPHIKDGAIVVNVASELGRLHNLPSSYAKQVSAAVSIHDLDALVFDPENPRRHEPHAAYSVSKAMLIKATALLAKEPQFTSRGIRLYSVCPGWVKTDMGGSEAPGTVQEGAASILAMRGRGAFDNGQFYRHGQPLSVD